jgi:hypothetical protein
MRRGKSYEDPEFVFKLIQMLEGRTSNYSSQRKSNEIDQLEPSWCVFYVFDDL